VACSDPELSSDLDTDGPPEVLEVNVTSETAPTDPNGNAVEAATFCRGGDEFKVSTFYCPLARDESDAPIPGDRALDGAVVDATPIGWNVRFIFSELIDPDIEDLVETDGVTSGSLADTQPFTVTCGGADISYDGWYDPSGNNLSYPPGPGLVATAVDFIATGSSCEIALRDGSAVDKDGDGVPSDMLGPYTFGIAPLTVAATDPAADAEGVDPTAPVSVSFNAPIDIATVTTDAKIALTDADGAAVAVDFSYASDDAGTEDQTVIVATPQAALAAGAVYTVTVSAGITDIAAGPLNDDLEPFSFTTGEAP